MIKGILRPGNAKFRFLRDVGVDYQYIVSRLLRLLYLELK